MDKNYAADGMFRAQDGSWVSVAYQYHGKELAFVSHFTHQAGDFEPHITFFLDNGKRMNMVGDRVVA